MLRRFYELSQKTDQDIDEIFNYTQAEYGFDQAVNYLGELEGAFIQLIQNPKLGKKREELTTIDLVNSNSQAIAQMYDR